MPKYTVISTRAESAEEEALRKWFDQQRLNSPTNLEDAAKLIIGLISGLLTVMFGVLAIAQKDLPGYLANPAVRWLGALVVALLFISLASALVVVLPFRTSTKSDQPQDQRQAFEGLLERKAIAITVTAVAFGLGIAALAAALVVALLS
ncbi:MAG TPA: hypothetical protein VGK81_12860 [Anaerolineae bacterium]